MTAINWTSICDQTTDAGFRAHFSELSAKFALAGLIQTADTGQINWTTVTRAAGSTAAGYEIWKFPDSSLFIKIEYGSAAANNYPSLWYTVGTGSNGSGTITGQLSTRNQVGPQNPPTTSLTTPCASYLCVTNSCFGLIYKVNAVSGGHIAFAIVGKTVDSAGAATTEGYGVMFVQPAAQQVFVQSVRLTAPAATYAASIFFGVAAGDLSNTALPSGDLQLFHCWMNDPKMRPFPWAVIHKNTELTAFSTVTAAMVASANHTYIAGGVLTTSWQGPNGQPNYRLAMIYE